MACVNLANLQIARGVARQQETSLRAALGASRSRLVQSVLVENLLLGLIGGLAGVALAFLGQRILLLTAATLPRLNEVHLSLPLLAFALGLSILTSLAFGILPALRALRAAPQNSLQANSTRHSASRQSARSRKLLVAVEVACSVTLLVITALITRSFSHLLTQDRQFAAEHVALAKADLSAARYSSLHPGMPDNPGADPGSLARDQMIDRTLDKLRTLPGVQSAALVSVLPLTGDVSVEMLHRPDHPLPASQTPLANRRFISPGYFATMSIPLLSGRDFTLQDRQNFASQASQSSPANQPSESNQSNQPDQPNQTVQKLQKVQSSGRVLILSERTAQAAFPGENPLGRTIRHWGYVYTVIGIAADARINDLKRNVAIFYLPYWDFPPNSPVFLVRTAPGIRTTIQPSTLRQTIWSVDPDISIPTVNSLDFQVSESVATERFQAVLLSSFGAAALLIAVLGIYGVLAYSVSLRTQEFGIRIALGSGRARLARLLLTDAAYPVLGGVAIGLLIAVLAARWVHSLLYETSAIDPLSITLSIAILLFASLLASLLPVHAATSVDPIQALRKE
jgi:predicted permease